LFLATRKINGKRFVVKQASPDCACNEFLYYSVAREIGLKTLEFHLFERDFERKGFRSRYAIAIEYIDGVYISRALLLKMARLKTGKNTKKVLLRKEPRLKTGKNIFIITHFIVPFLRQTGWN
jgi:hypothetical protein